MKKTFFGVVPLAVLILVTVNVTATENKNGGLDAMLAMMEGAFRTDPTELAGEEMPELLDRRVRVVAPDVGEYVVYWQLNSGPDEKVYRQRLLVFKPSANGNEIVQETWSLRDARKFTDAFDDAALFEALTPADLEQSLPDGCDQLWQRTENGWYGRVSPDSCRVWSERRQMWRRIGAEARVEPDAYWQAERGFDDDGNQVFGTKPDEMYRLQRLPTE